MAKSQWRFEPVVWGAPRTDEDRKNRHDRGGIGFDVVDADTGEFAASFDIAWLAEPDRLGATIEFTLHGWAEGDRQAFPSWVVHGRLIPRPGGVVISQISINPDAPWLPGASIEEEDQYSKPGDPPIENWMPEGGGITSGLLRKLPLGIVFAGVQALTQGANDSEEMRAFLQDISSDYPDFGRAIEETRKGASEEQLRAKRGKGGRPSAPDEYLREVAIAYLQLSGQRGVHALLSKRFNRSPDAIKEAIRAARRAGWLAPGQAGRRGAYPGPLLLAENADIPENEGSHSLPLGTASEEVILQAQREAAEVQARSALKENEVNEQAERNGDE
ncbi:hypothetical protein ACH3XX_42260 [Streptomyces scabiei]|uniref:hypothetical protein n=1 Tax=Streptomyces scabiei TaxID=1930 RepID=UPI001B318F9C|nr:MULTISPECIES: hypothetical protein [Streptomyces]MBP5915896.1 hypothetical protein [Streptomyces sp. LBUM 1486]MDX2629179.1 hypothetical protein [Streptomyces scabiei]MDX3030257.1 hypothetical protein [Streptomyces scabiei]MDX3168254.1 hypothetical protein [Streptomyces scabiei]MDX3207802.1 hypothetical protein [Streptomyces scabiei]